MKVTLENNKFLPQQQIRKAAFAAGSRPIPLPLVCRHATSPGILTRSVGRRIAFGPTSCHPKATFFRTNRQFASTAHDPDDVQAMSSNDAYASFLDQANQDTGASRASTTSESATTKAVDTEIPVGLQNVEQYYTSEADEPFEPVSLEWDGNNMPSETYRP
ncbi:MAG: hypothetical protein Q9201_003232 [Fulgogasparrea decipioides]